MASAHTNISITQSIIDIQRSFRALSITIILNLWIAVFLFIRVIIYHKFFMIPKFVVRKKYFRSKITTRNNELFLGCSMKTLRNFLAEVIKQYNGASQRELLYRLRTDLQTGATMTKINYRPIMMEQSYLVLLIESITWAVCA